MAMLTRTTILSWLLLFLADAYETWHLVDLAQVVCPKPTSSNPDAPVFPDYNLGINYSSELQFDAPHIVGFIRASGQAMSITFKVEDFYGEQVRLQNVQQFDGCFLRYTIHCYIGRSCALLRCPRIHYLS